MLDDQLGEIRQNAVIQLLVVNSQLGDHRERRAFDIKLLACDPAANQTRSVSSPAHEISAEMVAQIPRYDVAQPAIEVGPTDRFRIGDHCRERPRFMNARFPKRLGQPMLALQPFRDGANDAN